MDLLGRVRRTIRRHQLATAESRVLVALSGGSDSVALAHLLAQLSAKGELRLVGLAHFNHQLRPSADADERFCGEAAANLGLPLLTDRADVGKTARRERRSIEEVARTVRHGFLERGRLELGADVVAFGHTRDDQAETLLLRLMRGAGPDGLGGMHPRRGVIIRPVLDCRRAELQSFLRSQGLSFVVDETNADLSIPRNRIRAELLPFLEARFNPAVTEVLASEAALLRDTRSFMSEQSSEWLATHATRQADGFCLPTRELLELPVALARTVLFHSMQLTGRGRPIGFEDVERAFDLLVPDEGGFDAPGQRVQRIGGNLVLTSRREGRSAPKQAAGANLFEYPLSIPGEAVVLEHGAVVSAETAAACVSTSEDSNTAIVQVDPAALPLKVRTRRPGDRFQPLGMTGRKTLQDYFVDRKVTRERRDAVPIVVDTADRIVWVAGHQIGQEFRVKDPSQTVIILRLKAVGGSV